MEKDSDSVLPYIGLEGPSNHPEPQRSSGKNTLISSPSESPATKASTSQPEEISREKSYCAVPIESPRSQLAKEPPEPEDLRHGIMHIEEGLSKRRYSRVMPDLCSRSRRSPGLQSLGGIIDEHLRLHSDGTSQAASPSSRFATTAPLRILHRDSFVPTMLMIPGHGLGRSFEVRRDSVFELLDQFPSPISTPSPVTPGVGHVSPGPPPPSSPSDTPTMSAARASSNSDTSTKLSTYQRCSEMSLFSPLFQGSNALQDQGNHDSHDEPELVQFIVPGGFASKRGALARPPSDLSSSSQGGVSDIRPRSHWTAEEEALLDEYRCRSVQESNSDGSRVTRDSSIIFYNPFVADEGDDEEGEEDLPIEDLRKRLKLTSTLLPQSLENISMVLNSTTASCAQATSTEDPGLAGIGCGPRNRPNSSFMPSNIELNGSPRFSVRAPSTTPSIASTTVPNGYCPSVAPLSPAKANHDEHTPKRWTEVPFREYLPVDFELALGGTSRYPAFPSSPPYDSQFTISQQVVVTNQPLGRHPARSSPSVPSSGACNLPSPKLDNPTSYSQKCFSEQTLPSISRRLRNNPNSQDRSGVKVLGSTNANIPSYLPVVFGCPAAGNMAGNNVQTTDGSQSGSKGARRVHGASNWRPPTCWDMPGWEPAIELVGERDDQGLIFTMIHPCEASSDLVETVLSPAFDSQVIPTHTPSPSRSSPFLMSPKFWRSSPPAFIHRLASRSPHPNSL